MPKSGSVISQQTFENIFNVSGNKLANQSAVQCHIK